MNWLKRRLAHWLIEGIHDELKTRPAAGLVLIPPVFNRSWPEPADESSTHP